MKKRTLIFSLVCCSSLLFFSFKNRPPAKGKTQKVLQTIIVDAGHGIMPNGGHNGAHGSYSYEDDICLAIAKVFVRKLHEALPEIKVVETRPTEKITSLYRRAEIANENKGDLFFCIHVNAAVPIKKRELDGYKTVTYYTGKGKNRVKNTKQVPQYKTITLDNPAAGTETYIWGAHKTEQKELAVRENAPMMMEKDYQKLYGDIDPNSPEFVAVSLLKTKQYFRRSASLAQFVQDEFAKVGRVDRNVKQRSVGIWVLQATAMPSVLVETGYITNRKEEDYLNSQSGQEELATCMLNAVKKYIAWLEQQENTTNSTSKNEVIQQTDVLPFLQVTESLACYTGRKENEITNKQIKQKR